MADENLRIVSTNICGSDQHMVRGRTTAPPGLVLGHEITGEVIEKGRVNSIECKSR
jgi:glutathione-independent formaldehyde dehydrogenase